MRNLASMSLLAAAGAFTFGAQVRAADVPVIPPVFQPPPVSQSLMFMTVIDGWLGYRAVSSTDDPDDNSHFTYGGNAYASIPLGPRTSVQLDLQGEFHDDSNFEASEGAAMFGGHLSYRDPTSHLVGAFAGVGKPFADTIDDDSPGAYSGVGYVVGAEGQLYINNLTLYGQAGFGDFKVDDDGGPEGFVNGWFVRGVGRHFVNDNFFLQAEYAFGYTNCYIDGDCAPSEDAGIFHNWGAKAVGRLMGGAMPIYGTLEYQGGLYHADEDPDMGTEHSIRVGLRVLFGAGGAPTLLANDRYGATLDTPMLPVRAATWVPGMD